MSDTEFRSTPRLPALPDPADAAAVIYNPSPDHLRDLARAHETTTSFGAPSYVSEYRSRCADRTRNAVDDAFTAEDHALVEDAFAATADRELVCVDRTVGRDPAHAYVCRYYVPVEYARIALALARLLEPAPADATPDFVTVQLPDWDETAIRVLPDEGVTAVLGTDYTGEAKKSFLRLFMYYAKRQGGLGLHAGSKRLELDTGDGVETVGQLFLGLSATGKSTLTAHGLGLDPPEDASMLQDDVCALLPDGTVVGSEGEGLYVKTIGLDADEQPAMHAAVTHESAVLENVDVAADGTVDFDSDRYTTNGRAVISRDELASADADVDLDAVDQVFFITRNPLMPPVAKLDADEAAAAFMLGESIQTSAGDPDAAGEPIRVVGTNPFIVGPEGVEGNRFRDLIADLDVDCFVLNTGRVGDDPGVDVGVDESVTLLREIARGTVAWTDDAAVGLTVPAAVPGMSIEDFRVPDHVDDYAGRAAALRAERADYLAGFPELDDAIVDAVY